MPTTAELQKKYLEQGGVRCPYCDSDNITGGSFDTEFGEVYQKIWCEECHKEWTDLYKLVGFEERG